MTARDTIQRRRAHVPYAAALLTLSALGACTSGGAATPSTSSTTAGTTTTSAAPSATTTTATASPTTSVDPVIAKIPAAARTNDESGGVNFAKWYFAQLNEAFKTSNTTTIDALSSKACVTCAAFSQGVAQLKGQGRHYGADLVEVKSASALNFTDDNRQVVLKVKQSNVEVLDRAGAKVDVTPGGEASFIASLKFDSGHWTVMRLQKVKS